MLYLVYGSGNRDETVFPDPDTILLDDSRGHHLAFGRGEHVCLGANLARREAAVAIRALLDRLDDITLAAEVETVAYHPSFVLRGPRALPMTFRPGAVRA
jgi:cytochrome P450